MIDAIRFVPPPAPTSDPVGALNALWAFAAGLGFQPAQAAAGLPTYTEAREALAELLGLVELLATQCADRVDVSQDPRIARARAVGGT